MDFKQSIRWAFMKMGPFYIIHVITFLLSIIIRWEWVSNMETSILIKRIIIDLLLIKSIKSPPLITLILFLCLKLVFV